MPELSKQESYVLRIIPDDVNQAKGFNQLFSMSARASEECRIGSRETFVKALRRLKDLGFIDWIKSEFKGRRSLCYKTSLGKQYIKFPLQLESSAGIGELGLLKSFVPHVCKDGLVIIYSKTPLFFLLEKQELEDLVLRTELDKDSLFPVDLLSKLEWLLLDRFARKTFEKPQKLQAEESYELKFLERRFESSGRCKTNRESKRIDREIDEQIRKLRGRFGIQRIKDKEIYLPPLNKFFDELPLTVDEYRKYRRLKRESKKVNKAYERFNTPLAVLVCNYDFIDELLHTGPAVELKDVSIVLPEDTLRRLNDQELCDFEIKVREAVDTEKYVTGFIRGPVWPRPEDPKAIDWPPNLAPFERDWRRDAKKRYFRKVYDAILKEMERRGLKCKS